MTNFRNKINNLLTEKDTYLNTPKTFDDKEIAWYKGGINPNALFDANAIWYGMPKQEGHTNIIKPDWNSKFVVKSIKNDQENTYATLQEIREYLNNDNRWTHEKIGEPVYIKPDDLLTIIKSPKNHLLYDQIMKKNTMHPHDEDPDTWHNKVIRSNELDQENLERFYADHKEDFNLHSIEDAEYAKKYYDDGYSPAYIRAFISSPYGLDGNRKNDIKLDMSYNPTELQKKFRDLSNLKGLRASLEDDWNKFVGDDNQLSLNINAETTYSETRNILKDVINNIFSLEEKLGFEDLDEDTKKIAEEYKLTDIFDRKMNKDNVEKDYRKRQELEEKLWNLKHGGIANYSDAVKKGNTIPTVISKLKMFKDFIDSGKNNKMIEQELLEKIKALDSKIEDAEKEVTPDKIMSNLKDYEKDLQLKKCIWKIEDYADEIKKYGIK